MRRAVNGESGEIGFYPGCQPNGLRRTACRGASECAAFRLQLTRIFVLGSMLTGNPVRGDLPTGPQANPDGAQAQVTPDGVWARLDVRGSINRSPLAGFTETARRG
jgi:hypothetical protein